MPSSIRWQGGAAAVAQVQSYLFAGTWLAADTITLTVGSRVATTTAGSATIATLLASLATTYNALSSTSYPEMAEQTATSDATHLILTADSAGKPFAATISTNSALGTIDGAASSAGTTTTTSAGPSDWSTARNWSTGVVPVSTDSVYIENSNDDILYGLAQSGVTLALLSIAASFTGTLGLPEHNTDSTTYEEYRQRALLIKATVENISYGPGSGSGRILRDASTAATTLTVLGTGSGLDSNLEALLWKGTNAANVLNVLGGSVAVAGYGTDTATVATLRVAGSAAVRCGAGTTLTAIKMDGGTLSLASAATTLDLQGGTCLVQGTGAIATVNVIPAGGGATLVYQGTGTLTTLTVGTGGSVDWSQDVRSRIVTSTNLYQGAQLNDPFGTVTFSTAIQLVHCRLGDVAVDVGTNRTVAIGGVAP